MADHADRADKLISGAVESGVNAIRANFEAKSLSNCIECGLEIPEARRELGGVVMCVDCASKCERMDAMHR